MLGVGKVEEKEVSQNNNWNIQISLFKGGIFSLPSHLSQGAKDLLSCMLLVDPVKRATIADIRTNVWFKIALPEYLKPLPENQADAPVEPDTNCLNELIKKMGFSKETILFALSEKSNNQVKVAYQLVHDRKLLLEGGE